MMSFVCFFLDFCGLCKVLKRVFTFSRHAHLKSMNSDEFSENFESISGYLVDLNTPSPAKFCYNCNRRVRGFVVTDDLGLTTCASCIANSQSIGSASEQRPDEDADDEASDLSLRLDFGDIPAGVPDTSDGSTLRCVECGCFGAVYFSQHELDLREAMCLRCALEENGIHTFDPASLPDSVFEKETLPDSEPES